MLFQHTAARRRLAIELTSQDFSVNVSTHSRPKAAGYIAINRLTHQKGFNTQPPEGGWPSEIRQQSNVFFVSTHSRPKAAGSQAKSTYIISLFQHTAARRRLGSISDLTSTLTDVSTHSRPKAAGISATSVSRWQSRFNTQPPEGGWSNSFI